MLVVPSITPASSLLSAQPRERSLAGALTVATVAVWFWVMLAAWLNQAQLHDSLEQFVWGQSLQWGYWKHPPLTSWLMWAGLKLMGPTPLASYVLAACMTSVALVCTALIARELLGRDAAIFTAMLLALHYGFSRRAKVYNHNTVLIAFVALAVWATLLALRQPRAWRWWLAGLVWGTAVLAKYQALVPMAVVLLLVMLSRQRPRPAQLLMAACGAVCVVAPHAAWMAAHGLSAVKYALAYVEPSGAGVLAERSASFVAMQAKYFLAPSIFILAVMLWVRRGAAWRGPRLAHAHVHAHAHVWTACLAAAPVVMVLSIAWGVGVRMQPHWGLQATQFLLLVPAGMLAWRHGGWSRRHGVAWFAVQAIALLVFAGQTAGLLHYANAHAAVRAIPARAIAAAADDWWRERTGCRLTYLSGGVATAGLIAAYAPNTVRVLEDGDFAKSPWIDEDDMVRRGWVEVSLEADPPPDPDALTLPFEPHEGRPAGPQLVLRPHLPQRGCDG